MEDKYRSYVISSCEVLKHDSQEAKKQKDNAKGTADESFATGYLCAYYHIVTLLQQQAEPYDISLTEIGLDINENDLI